LSDANLDDCMIKLENEFIGILNELDHLDAHNFQTKFDKINSMKNKIAEGRINYLKQFERSQLKKYNPKFDLLIKQITKKFDSIVLEKRNKQREISSQLKILLNQKKLVNYQR